MVKKKHTHKYLMSLYSRVEDFLTSEKKINDDLPDSIVSFCIVVEKILKIKLHNKNPILVFDVAKVHDEKMDILAAIIQKKEKNIETLKIKETLGRFESIFKKTFTPDEVQALQEIYYIRNSFVHGYKSDEKIMFDSEDVIKKMGTLWEKVSTIAVKLFGKENIKSSRPKKKYTEAELKKVLEDEVRKMIEPSVRNGLISRNDFRNDYISRSELALTTNDNWGATSVLNNDFFPAGLSIGDRCPRCDAYGFSLSGNRGDTWSGYESATSIYGFIPGDVGTNLYKCKKCNLELTEKQYEIAKQIRG